MIKVTYETTKKDFQEFNIFVLKRRIFRKAMLLPLLVWIIGVIIMGFMLFPSYYLIWKDGITLGIVLVIITLPLIIIGISYLLRIFLANHNYDNFPLQYAARTIGFDQDGVHVLSTAVNKDPDTIVPWRLIQEIVKTQAYIYVLQSKSVAYPIPLRIFASPEQANSVVAELEQWFKVGHSQPSEIKENVVVENEGQS